MAFGAKPIWQKETRALDRPIFAKFKNHSCFLCGERLELIKVTHFQIKKGSPEARGKLTLRFDIFNHPVDFTFYIFICAKCENKISINDLYYLEKPQKKKSKYYNEHLLIDKYRVYLQSQDRKNGGNEYQKYLDNLKKQIKEK